MPGAGQLRDVLLSRTSSLSGPESSGSGRCRPHGKAVAGRLVGTDGHRPASGCHRCPTFLALGRYEASLGNVTVTWLRYGIIGALGATFLYYGLKAVQLTEMSNRVWKRTAEYNLILAERKRLGR